MVVFREKNEEAYLQGGLVFPRPANRAAAHGNLWGKVGMGNVCFGKFIRSWTEDWRDVFLFYWEVSFGFCHFSFSFMGKTFGVCAQFVCLVIHSPQRRGKGF